MSQAAKRKQRRFAIAYKMGVSCIRAGAPGLSLGFGVHVSDSSCLTAEIATVPVLLGMQASNGSEFQMPQSFNVAYEPRDLQKCVSLHRSFRRRRRMTAPRPETEAMRRPDQTSVQTRKGLQRIEHTPAQRSTAH